MSIAADEYRVRLNARRTLRDTLTTVDARLAYSRLATVAVAAILGLAAWRLSFSPAWLLLPAAVFVLLVRWHERVLQAREQSGAAIAFYERGLARLEDQWIGSGSTGERFQDDTHVYATDLDLFGRGSLFELLSLARTDSGEALLARWLMAAADPPEIRARQAAVRELSHALDLRERLALSGAHVATGVSTRKLLDWAESPLPQAGVLRWMIRLSTAAFLVAVAWLVVSSAWWPLTLVLAAHAVAARAFRDQINRMLGSSEPGTAAHFVEDLLSQRSRDLDALGTMLRHLEGARFEDDRLARLRSGLGTERAAASRIIRRLHRLCEMHDWQRNAAALPLGLLLYGLYTARTWAIAVALIVSGMLLLLRPQLALAVDGWRRRHGQAVRVWIDTVAQFEALASLAAYCYEHAGDPFPEIIDAGPDGPVFDAAQVGHPILSAATMVRNDVRLASGTRLLVVSGSNMSGKSTLLRAVGISAVMALAGAPVRAASLRLSPLAVGATLRIQDSLLAGRSRFYAEITRIRALSDIAAGPAPLLFLLDELFHGTNSHDRLLGAEGVLRSLLDRGAVGLITTHDLALTAIADKLAPRAVNVHFQDAFDAGEIAFDYRMKPGPVTRSNALALMRAVGLEVGPPLAG